METFFGGLGLAAVTGLTIMAYRHPRGYTLVRKVLTLALGSIIAVSFAWTFGTVQAYSGALSTAVRTIPASRIDSYDFAIEAIDAAIHNFLWISGVCLVALGYLWLLKFLPLLTQDEDKGQAASE